MLEIKLYNQKLSPDSKVICDLLLSKFKKSLPGTEAKIWHGHPVWFHNGNPVVGYSQMKNGIQILFWSGQSFTQSGLTPVGKFKAAGIYVSSKKDPKIADLALWLKECQKIQWDYANLPKKKKLTKLTKF
jgi:hypothetical protein